MQLLDCLFCAKKRACEIVRLISCIARGFTKFLQFLCDFLQFLCDFFISLRIIIWDEGSGAMQLFPSESQRFLTRRRQASRRSGTYEE